MKKRIDLPQVSDVTLPEVFHLRPGVWILIILAILIIVLFFLIALLPGIIKGGRYVTFSAPLSESGIILDGTYLGSSDHQYFITSGEHTVTVVKGGIEYEQTTIHIDHPILLTHLIHRTRSISIPAPALSSDEAMAIIRHDLSEIQKASAILEWTMVTRYAPLYQNLAQDLTALDYSDEGALILALSYITTEEMLADARLAFSSHPSPTIQALLKSAEMRLHETAGATAKRAVQTLDLETTPALLSLPHFALEGSAYPATSVVMGTTDDPSSNEYAITVEEEAFALSHLPITITEWAYFIEENPMWAKSNKESLEAQGLVDASYLSGLAPSTIFVTSRPITNISYQAANAFCAWLSEKSGKRVFLPTEAMFTIAAQNHPNLTWHASLTPMNTKSDAPAMLLGGVWEMTQTPFIPLSRLCGYQETIALHTAFSLEPNPIVKGGSYLNDSTSISADTVGVVPAHACGDQIGFRVAWYE